MHPQAASQTAKDWRGGKLALFYLCGLEFGHCLSIRQKQFLPIALLKRQVCWPHNRNSFLVFPLFKEPTPLIRVPALDQALWAGSLFLRAEGSETLPLGWWGPKQREATLSSSFPFLWLLFSETLRGLRTKQDAEVWGQDKAIFPRLRCQACVSHTDSVPATSVILEKSPPPFPEVSSIIAPTWGQRA